jgi:hypothetical protein
MKGLQKAHMISLRSIRILEIPSPFHQLFAISLLPICIPEIKCEDGDYDNDQEMGANTDPYRCHISRCFL